jgi:hypothetical protein
MCVGIIIAVCLCFVFSAFLSMESKAQLRALDDDEAVYTSPLFINASGSAQFFGKGEYQDTLFIHSETFRILKLYTKQFPRMLVWGSPGIGKSALAQLVMCVELLRGEWVLQYFKGTINLLKYHEDTGLLDSARFFNAAQLDDALDQLNIAKRDLKVGFICSRSILVSLPSSQSAEYLLRFSPSDSHSHCLFLFSGGVRPAGRVSEVCGHL